MSSIVEPDAPWDSRTELDYRGPASGYLHITHLIIPQ